MVGDWCDPVDDEGTVVHLDVNGDLHVLTTQNVEGILDHNKNLRNEAQRSDWGRHVASIPNVILTRWLNEEWARGNNTINLGGPEVEQLIERKLADPDWAYLRTDSKHTQAYVGYSGPILGAMGFGS